MPNRNGQSEGYRYGYQGSEKDDEVHGQKGTSYTTYFRGLDTRIGKWLSVDPKATAWESSYVSMGNSPVWNNDVLGDTWKNTSDKTKAADLTKQLTKKQKRYQKEADKYFSKAQKYFDKGNYKRAEKYSKKGAENSIGAEAMKKSIKEISEMGESKEYFTFREKPKTSKLLHTYSEIQNINGTNKNVTVIEHHSDATAIHELAHAYQGLVGDLKFRPNEGTAYYADLGDEVTAYKRQFYFNKGSVMLHTKSELGRVSSSNITKLWVLKINYTINLPNRSTKTIYPYSSHSETQILKSGIRVNGFYDQKDSEKK